MITEAVVCTISNDTTFITGMSCDITNFVYLLFVAFGVVTFLLAVLLVFNLFNK